MTVRTITAPAGLAALPTQGVAPISREAWAVTRPDVHLAATDTGGLAARASVWWTHPPADPERPGARIGCIGHLDGRHADALAVVVSEALDVLRQNGASRVVGPMDGSTWHAYRVVSDASPEGTSHPPFALEPWPPARVEEALRAGGFEPVAHYHSALFPQIPDRSEALSERLGLAEEKGVTLRRLDPHRAEAELGTLYDLSLDAFARNPYFAPILREAFLATYRPLVPRIDPRLLLIAEHHRQPVGVVFGLADWNEAARGETVRTLVFKTLAVRRALMGQGLGSLLSLALEEAAREMGLTRSIHALMHDANRSVRISQRREVDLIRRYALLGRKL